MKLMYRQHGAGFTLIEMLVVVAIISIVVAITFPMVAAMKRDSGASAAVNTVTIAITSARRYATTPEKHFAGDLRPEDADPSEWGLFSGVAALFTPAGEIRLVENDPWSFSANIPDTFLERLGPTVIPFTAQGNLTPKRELNGFVDLSIDYLLLSSDTGVAGIYRDASVGVNDGPRLLPPPFAIWFDQNGYMVVTGVNPVNGNPNDYQFIYYDGDHDGFFDERSVRPNNYDPDESNPYGLRYDPATWDQDLQKYRLPFEKIEAVIGIYVYSVDNFRFAVEEGVIADWTDRTDAANDDRWDWLKENGDMILFSRATGTIMRNRDE